MTDPTTKSLDEAAKVAGRHDFDVARRNCSPRELTSIRAHATTLDALAKATDALAEIDRIAVRREWAVHGTDNLEAVAKLAAPYRAKVDPLVEALDSICIATVDYPVAEWASRLRNALASRGLEIVAKESA